MSDDMNLWNRTGFDVIGLGGFFGVNVGELHR